MLVLSRHRDETIMLGDDIEVTVVKKSLQLSFSFSSAAYIDKAIKLCSLFGSAP